MKKKIELYLRKLIKEEVKRLNENNSLKKILQQNNIQYENIEIDEYEIAVIVKAFSAGKKWEAIENKFYKLFPDGEYDNKDIYLQGM